MSTEGIGTDTAAAVGADSRATAAGVPAFSAGRPPAGVAVETGAVAAVE